MSDYDDEEYQTSGHETSEQYEEHNYESQNETEEEKEEGQATETESSQTYGHRDETDDGEHDHGGQDVMPAKVSTSRITIGSVKNIPSQQESVDEDSGIDADTAKKTRRRDKDASADVLNVIDWSLNGGEKYDGSDYVPEVPEGKQTEGDADPEEVDDDQEEVYVDPVEVDADPEEVYADQEEVYVDQVEVDANPEEVYADQEEVYVDPEEVDADPEEVDADPNEVYVDPEEVDADPEVVEDSSKVFENTDQLSPSTADVETVDEEENNDTIQSSTQTNGMVTDRELKESLDFLKKMPDVDRMNSDLLDNLMDSYLDKDYVNRPPTLKKPVRAPTKPSSRKTSTGEEIQEMEDLEKNLKSIREKNKKQPPPPVRNKPPSVSKAWEDPREQQRLKVKEKQWPPKEPPKDIGAYVVESYGRTDPYTKQLIKDVQRSKREEEEKKQAKKRSEIVSENTQPVHTLRDTFSSKPNKASLGALRPQTELHGAKSWIRHEKKPVVYDDAPDEPDWMKLIRNRRWKSTVKARFPCKETDKTDFERRSTTPKNWKKLAKDKNALRMLSEIVGIGAEGEELFLRLAEQRQKVEDQKEQMDRLAEEEILAYQVARESLGEDAAYSLQMDNPLPAARMKPVSASTNKSVSGHDNTEFLPGLSNDALAGYPFTTSQLEAAYLSNQLLRLHPEEFRKLISLDRSRQATLRWQFSADPFDSVHEHQNLPYEMALLASDEPRVLQAMRKIVATGSDDYRSVFSSIAPTPQPRSRARSDGGAYNGFYYESDGYESSNSISSSSSMGVPRGRTKKKKAPIPIPKQARGRSVSPSMMNQGPPTAPKPRLKSSSGSTLKVPSKHSINSEPEVCSHSLFDDSDLQLADEIEDLNRLTSNLAKNIDEDLKGITSTLEDRKKGFFEEAIRNESEGKGVSLYQDIDTTEISNRRKGFVEKDLQNSSSSDVRVDLPKTRHKVRRINSNAQLNAVFGGRRQMSEAETSEGGENASNDNNNNSENAETKEQLADVLSDIQTHYGE